MKLHNTDESERIMRLDTDPYLKEAIIKYGRATFRSRKDPRAQGAILLRVADTKLNKNLFLSIIIGAGRNYGKNEVAE